MINLFNIANTARNLKKAYDNTRTPYQKALKEERHYDLMEKSPQYRNVNNFFRNTKQKAEWISSAFSRVVAPVKNTVESFTSFVPKKMSDTFFADENIVYENMRWDGISDKDARNIIYERRKEMLGGREYLNSEEQNMVKFFTSQWASSEDILGALNIHRQKQEEKRQAEIQAKIDEHNAYLADPSKGIIGWVDEDFQFSNTFWWLNNAWEAITLRRNDDDGFLESAGKTALNIPWNLLRIGAGVGNIASTAIQEWIYDTPAGMINQWVKAGTEYVKDIGNTYSEARERKWMWQWLLNAANKVIVDTTNAVVNNPIDTMTLGTATIPKGAAAKVAATSTVYRGAIKASTAPIKMATKPISPIVKSVVNTAKKYFLTPDELAGIQAAIRPKVTRKGNVIVRSQEQINTDIRITNGLIRESGAKPTDLASYKEAVKAEMTKIGDEINRLTGQNLEVDLTTSIGKLEELANSTTTQILDSGDGNKITALIENLKQRNGRLSVADAEDMNQWLNDTLKSHSSGASETTKRGYQILVGDIRNALDESISQIPGQFKEIKKAYGSLRNVYGDIIKREIVYNRQNPNGLVESIGAIAWAWEVVGGVGKILTGRVGEGFSQIGKGVTSNAVGNFITHKNNPNTIIKKIFEKNPTHSRTLLPRIVEGGKGMKSGDDIVESVKYLKNAPLEEFGKNFSEYAGKWQKAIEKVIAEQQWQVVGAFKKKWVGYIDVVWGKVIDANKHTGYGMAHIRNKHPDITPKIIAGIIKKWKVVENSGVKTIVYATKKAKYRVWLSQWWKWDNHWIVTSYKKNPLTENFDQHMTANAVKNGTDLSSRDYVNSIHKNPKIANKSSQKLSYTNRNLDAPTISQKEAKNIVRKYFSDDQVSVKLADRIVANDGVEALGMYHKKMIAFAKNPTKYTPEHEVFHAYFDMALKSKEKNAILKAIMKEKNFVKKIDAEEFMADTFAEFVVGRREVTGLAGKMANIFDDLSYMFKKFFGQEDKVERLYRELESIGKGQSRLTSHNNILSSKKKYFIDHTGKKAEDIVVPRKKKNETWKELWIRRELEKDKAIKKYGWEYIEGVEFDKMPKAYKDAYNSYKSFVNSIEDAKSEWIKGVDIMGNTKILNIVKKLWIKALERKEWNGFGYKTIGRNIDMKDALKIAKKMRTELDEASNKYTAKIIKQWGKFAEDITIERYRNEYREHPQETIADALYNLNKEAKKIRDQRTKLKWKIYGDDEWYAARYSDWQRQNAHEKLQDLFDEMEWLYNLKDATIEKMIQKFDLKPKGYHEFSNGSQMDYYEFGGRGFHVDRNISTNSLWKISEQISSKKVGKKMSLDVVKKVLAFLDDETLNMPIMKSYY